MEDDVVTQGSMLPIRILWKNDKKWMLNPHPNDIIGLSKLWLYENKPIDRLLWDLSEWKWKTIPGQGMLGKQKWVENYYEGVWLLRQQLVNFGDLVMYTTLGWMLFGNGYGPCNSLKCCII